jgi:plasmid stabilization system protein ParE
VKTPKSYKFSDLTLARIADIEAWLPADSATHAIEEAIADLHRKLQMRREIGDLQAQLTELWPQFEQHPHYGVYTTKDGVEVMYNSKEHAHWHGQKGIFSLSVMERQDGIYKTAYTVYKLRELAGGERWFVP